MSTQPTSPSAPPNAALTRAAVTTITLLIAALSFAFCFGNSHDLCISLGVDGWIAWLIGPSVDLSVIGLLVAVRYLASAGYTGADLAEPRRLLVLCGLLTLALNTADALTHGRYGTAAVNAIGPILLICWSDVGPWLVAELGAVTHRRDQPRRLLDTDSVEPVETSACDSPEPQDQRPDTVAPDPTPHQQIDLVPGPAETDPTGEINAACKHDPQQDEADLWARALRAGAEHRATTGRPISRDALRDALRISRDRASDLKHRLREHTAHTARSAADPDPTGHTEPQHKPADQPAAPMLASTSA